MKTHVLATTILLVLILSSSDTQLVKTSILAGIYCLAEISLVLKQLIEQRKESSEQLLRTLESIASETLKSKN